MYARIGSDRVPRNHNSGVGLPSILPFRVLESFACIRVHGVPLSPRSLLVLVCALAPLAAPQDASAQTGAQTSARTGDRCATSRTISTIVGAGLGGSIAAIPATIIHRHDQTSSHRIVAVSVSAGAIIGFIGAGRDQPCASRSDSLHLTTGMVARRSSHAGRGAIAGAVVGGIVGAVGGTFYNIGCGRDPCNATRARVNVIVFSAAEGAAAGGILGSLIGWAWPTGPR